MRISDWSSDVCSSDLKAGKALPAQPDSRMLPATRRQAEVVEAIGQRLAGNSDLETVAYRESRQALPTGLMMLREEDLLLAAVQCPPAVDPAFQCSSYRIGNSILAELVLERLEDREDRKSVVWGKGVSVRVDHGGRRIIKK